MAMMSVFLCFTGSLLFSFFFLLRAWYLLDFAFNLLLGALERRLGGVGLQVLGYRVSVWWWSCKVCFDLSFA